VDYPPLLPAGLHPKTWGELEALCVTAFQLSQSREEKFSGLRRLIDRLRADGIEGELWVDGSFLTQKNEPGDIDIVLSVDLNFVIRGNPEQLALLSRLGSANPATRAEVLRDYSCDTYILFDIPVGDPNYPGRDMRQYWLDQFGSDRSGNPKGIAVVSIHGGVL
jgi:hypothetical protein